MKIFLHQQHCHSMLCSLAVRSNVYGKRTALFTFHLSEQTMMCAGTKTHGGYSVILTIITLYILPSFHNLDLIDGLTLMYSDKTSQLLAQLLYLSWVYKDRSHIISSMIYDCVVLIWLKLPITNYLMGRKQWCDNISGWGLKKVERPDWDKRKLRTCVCAHKHTFNALMTRSAQNNTIYHIIPFS